METFDFVIVGAGSAGSVLANRLSEDPTVHVLVLEAGPPQAPEAIQSEIKDPASWYKLLGSAIDWGYKSEPQPQLAGRVTHEARGKLLGGTSNLYIMMHIRGHPSDFDAWAANGCPGWTFQEVLPYFQRLENQEDAGPLSGKGGPLYVANASLHHPNPVSGVFIQACLELGYPYTTDFNGPNMEGTGWHHVNIKDGKRYSVMDAYLAPAKGRPNLTLMTNAQATRLRFDGKRCIGVEYVQRNQSRMVQADGEVIVCAGAIESPKLLLLSGIGDPGQLQQFNIPVTTALPGVGKNFHNHVLAQVIRRALQTVPSAHLNLSESALFCKSKQGGTGPDLQLSFVHVPGDASGILPQNTIWILPGVVRPLARGSIRLASNDPLAKPLIDPNYLGVEADRQRLAEALKLARAIFATNAFSAWAGEEIVPGSDVQTDAQILNCLTKIADTYHHQVGSCKMGTDDMAVVDPQLRVCGIEGLRVADASVIPAVPSGNCHAAIVMIAERASDFIKDAYHRKRSNMQSPLYHHIALTCSDPIAIERFYTKHFGFKRARVADLGGGKQIVFIKAATVYLELFQKDENAPTATSGQDGPHYPGWRHIAFKVENIDAKLDEMGDEAKIMLGPADFNTFIPGWRSVWIADPGGNIVEISQGFVDQTDPPALT